MIRKFEATHQIVECDFPRCSKTYDRFRSEYADVIRTHPHSGRGLALPGRGIDRPEGWEPVCLHDADGGLADVFTLCPDHASLAPTVLLFHALSMRARPEVTA